MPPHHHFHPLTALGVLVVSTLVPAVPAHAAAGAQATIEHMTFNLTDLDLADGVMPSYSLVNDPALNRFRTELTADVANSVLGTSDGGINAAFDFIAPLVVDRSVVGNEAHASTSPTGASASALSEAKGSASAFASAESNLLFVGDFGLMLSPATQLTIAADALVTAFDFGAPGAEGFAFEFAQAESFLRVRGADAGDGAGPQDDFSARSAATTADGVADALDMSGPLSVTFRNLGAAPLYAYVSVRSTAAAFGVTPVPEPTTWLLWATGAALMWPLARRRR